MAENTNSNAVTVTPPAKQGKESWGNGVYVAYATKELAERLGRPNGNKIERYAVRHAVALGIDFGWVWCSDERHMWTVAGLAAAGPKSREPEVVERIVEKMVTVAPTDAELDAMLAARQAKLAELAAANG
jgi:hypothetical protein